VLARFLRRAARSARAGTPRSRWESGPRFSAPIRLPASVAGYPYYSPARLKFRSRGFNESYRPRERHSKRQRRGLERLFARANGFGPLIMNPRMAPATAPFSAVIESWLERTMPPGAAPLSLFTTLARDERLFVKFFSGGLLDRGHLTLRQ